MRKVIFCIIHIYVHTSNDYVRYLINIYILTPLWTVLSVSRAGNKDCPVYISKVIKRMSGRANYLVQVLIITYGPGFFSVT